MNLESLLEDTLYLHPYLLHSTLKCLERAKQVVIGRARADILFRTPRGWVIVELKKTALTPRDVSQLRSYISKFAPHYKPLAKSHYLVGLPPIQDLSEALSKPGMKIVVKTIGNDIPTQLKLLSGKYRKCLVDEIPDLSFRF